MSENPLFTIMAPKSVAIVGASNNPLKMGTMQFLNILNSDYPGEIIPVHPSEEQVFGVKAYKNILDLPCVPDLAMLVVPTGLVVNMLDDFGKLGVRHAIIISAGFKETGEAGQDLEKRLLDVAARHGIRFLGPNCMGVFNSQHPFNATVTPFMDKPGRLSIASQSGTYLAQTLGYLKDRGVRVNQAISVGNEANISLEDCLEYLGQDDKTRAIGLYIEALSDPARFLEAAREITRTKPIVAQYVGGTKAGARSGLSHTGSIAGPNFLYDGLFAQAGVIRVKSIEEVYRIGHVLATQPPMKGGRLAVLTHSGGPGSAMCDTADGQGLLVEELPPEVQEKIRAVIPPHASSSNPVDLTFTTETKPMTEIIPTALLESEAVDGLLIHGIMDTGWTRFIHATIGKYLNVSYEDMEAMSKADLSKLIEMPAKYGKPIIASSFMGLEDHALNVMHENFIPVFDSPEKAAFAMGALRRASLVRERKADAPRRPGGMGEQAAAIIKQAGGALDEHQAKLILKDYGIGVCAEARASTWAEALEAAREIGWPVVLKGCSSEVMHKTEKGAVRLNLSNEQELEKAWKAVQEAMPGADVLVCEMLPAQREFMAGATRFDGFPPCLLFGLGGVLAEALKDVSLRMAPLSPSEALEFAGSLKARALLGDFRGLGAVDMEALASMLERLGWLMLDHPEIKEIDLNPVLIKNGRPAAADALMVL